MDKEHIILEIKRTAADNGGVPLGIDLFREATGIRKADWYGKFWAKWSDAQAEAGFKPNRFGTPMFDEKWMLGKIAEYTRELGHFPTQPEFIIRKRIDAEFPNVVTLRSRLGNKAEMLDKVLEFSCADEAWADVTNICLALKASLTTNDQSDSSTDDGDAEIGHVYLLKHNKEYKIGRSIDAARRYKQISTQMPFKTEEIHVIETDDPPGIEAYWHKRFEDKRLNGEWFKLSTADVKAFKKRRFM